MIAALITLFAGAMLLIALLQDRHRRKAEKLLSEQQVKIETLSAKLHGARRNLSLHELRTGRKFDEHYFGGAEL